jgi:hypothetical protein
MRMVYKNQKGNPKQSIQPAKDATSNVNVAE